MHIVIVGAGILGASTAFHLARGGAPVTIIDANLDGRATAAGAGIICPWVSGVEDPLFYRLYAASGDYYTELITALADSGETTTGYRQTGAMLVSADQDDLAWMERMVRQRAEPGMGAVTRVSAREAQRMFPPLRPDLGGVFVSGGARVDGRLMAAALLRAAQSFGAKMVHGLATLVEDAGRIIAVAVDDQRIPAERVIVTAGAWTDPVLRTLHRGVPVQPQRGQIVHLRLEGVNTVDWPVILPPGSHYIVPFDDGRVVVGATRETGAGFDYRVTAAGQTEVLAEALRIAPGLGNASLLETRVGFRPAAAAVRPLLGWMPDLAGLIVGTGLGAAGLTIGPYAGRLLAALATDQPRSLDLEPFAPAQQAGRAAQDTVVLR